MLESGLELLLPQVNIGGKDNYPALPKELVNELAEKALQTAVEWMEANKIPVPIIRLVEDTFFLRTLIYMERDTFSPLGPGGYDTEVASCISRLAWNMDRASEKNLW